PDNVMNEIARLTPSYSAITYEKLQVQFGIQWPCNKENPDGTRSFMLKDADGLLQFVVYLGSFDVPVSNEEFPFLLMISNSDLYWHQNNLMRKTFIPMREYNAALLLYPNGYVEISKENARELQIRDSGTVRIISMYGSMEVAAVISDNVLENTAHVPFFVKDKMTKFLWDHEEILKEGENTAIPVRIEKV
ncbi:hypothetical protein KA005_25730, partial [bacterium]|nr:hypothetical protein [bacterium]